MTVVRYYLRLCSDVFEIVLALVSALVVLMAAGKILAPLWPVTTLCLVFFLTLTAWSNGDSLGKLMCVAGLALYAASWPLTDFYGVWPGVLACCAGFATWIMSFQRATTLPSRQCVV